jgi:TonB family protein
VGPTAPATVSDQPSDCKGLMVPPQPIFRASPPSRPSVPPSVPSPDRGPEWLDDESGLYLAELAATLASHGGGPLSADLALDLLLNEVVEQACLATNATGAAIALARDREMVCRATTGVNAPGLGVRLNTSSGLSGACFRTREAQLCDDTENDPRVDAAACRELDVRSILVVPVLHDEELLGVFEIFSTQPAAFGERDIRVMQSLSRRIVENLRHAQAKPAAPLEIRPLRATVAAVHPEAEFASPGILFGGPEPPATRTHRRDYWTGILIAIVVMLALLLGWMVGRAGRQRTATLAAEQAIASSPEQETLSMPQATPTPDPAVAATQPPPQKEAVDSPVSHPSSTPSKKAGTTGSSTGGLAVYENGKLIYKMPPAEKLHDSGTELAGLRSDETAEKTGNEAPAGNNPVAVSTETAWAHLALRVEPDYPEQARQQHLQGPVVLKALVGKDGGIRKLKVISGKTQLATAATAAVRQWRFKPYRQGGQLREFETRITVNFTLPQN